MILCLDFDGVLHPVFPRADRTDSENQHFSYLPRLVRVLQDFPELRILITSTWGHSRDLHTLRAIFPRAFHERIIGKTTKLPGSNTPGGRLAEVQAWMATHAPGTPWVALDDMPELYAPGCCVVACLDGFTEDEASRLRAALANPGAYAQHYPVPDMNDPREKGRIRIAGER